MEVRTGWVVISLLLAPQARARSEDGAFVDVTRERRIAFTTVNGASGRKYLVETMLGGAAWIDYDGDGWLDLYLVQGHRRPEKALDGPGDASEPTNRLLRNSEGRRFTDVTGAAGVGDRGYGMGAATGDYDGDGHVDLYVTNYGRNTLYRNLGDGTFEDVTEQAGVAGNDWSTSATFADVDGDGRLDLFVVNYLDYDTRRDGACAAKVAGSSRTVPAYCHPSRFDGGADVLYRNLGDGRFRDVSEESGITTSGGRLAAKGLGVVASDFDADGDVDLLVANDSVANALWRNLGAGRFEDVALEVGFALNGEGRTEAGMGLCRGDVDANGSIDYFVTNFSRETNTLYLNTSGFFEDGTVERRLARPGYLRLAFGAVFLDHDLDGDLDLYVANGHIHENVEELHPGERIGYGQADQLLENDGHGFFRDVSGTSGVWFERALVGRGVAAGDYDNDGDIDLVVTHIDAPVALLENRKARGTAWVGVELRAARDAGVVHNTWVELQASGRRRLHEVQTDGSYLCAHDPRVAFGLGASPGEARARVRWAGREDWQDLGPLAPGRYHRIERKVR